MARPKALIAAPNHWLSPFQVGSHHIARALVDFGWDVAFIPVPISARQLLGRETVDLGVQADIYRRGGVTDCDGHLWAYVPGAVVGPRNRPVLRSEWLHRNWWRFTIPNVSRVVGAHGFDRVDLLYFDSLVQNFWLRALDHRRSVLRVADRISAFPKQPPAAITQQRQLAP